MSKVKIYTTRGLNGQVVDIPEGVVNWGQLKTVLHNEGVCLQDMSAYLGGSDQAFEDDQTRIPVSEQFGIFLVQQKTKSGKFKI